MRAPIQNLYARYERTHLRLSGRGQRIIDAAGALVGHVDVIALEGGCLRVAGWVRARKVALLLSGLRAEAVPGLRRDDVAAVHGGPATVGFDLTLPGDRAVIATSAAPGLVFEAETGAPPIAPVPLPIPVPLSARLAVRAGFLRDGLRAAPDMARWLWTRDPVWRTRIKARLRLGELPVSGLLSGDLFAAAVPRPVAAQRITIVLPVHNAYELLQECLVRVLGHTDLPWRLILVEDGSTDPRIRPMLRDWAAGQPEVELIENDRNLGFIGSVNRGLARAMQAAGPDEGPVVLLNSDALVPQGWASRLVRPMQARPEIASVTPMSNDAEILSAPVICQRAALTSGQADAIDAVARRLSPDAVLPELPTGVGFCMALARPWLARVGQLDTAFGRGYGEEVDWCRRIARMGGVHVAQPGLFVEHRGGESFGQEEKRALIARAGQIISRRYPDFDGAVQRFIATDPLRTARLALGLAWAGSVDPEAAVPVYLAHSMGGGADLYLEERIAADLAQGRPSVVLRVGGARRWRIELVTPLGRSHGECDDAGLLRELLACLPRRQLVYSCGVGDPDPVEIPALLLSLLGPQDSAQMLFHDYFPLSPAYTLLGSDGIYRGPVRAPDADPAHIGRRPDGRAVPLAVWQAEWKALAARSEIVAFSANSAWHVATVWPDLRPRIVIRPHGLRQPVPALLPVPGRPVVIGALGNIGLQKGAGVLRDLAGLLAGRAGGPGLVLVGNIDPAYALPRTAPVHGDYSLTDMPALTERYGITHWLIPSIWPETYCYTLHEALATRLPVLAFDIGAQGEAVQAAANGIAVPFGDGRDLAARILSAIEARAPAGHRRRA